ncbi:Zn-ribbon domain-containing OB-fold protein [Rhodococcus qingshengii]|uniref:Zn-ribbon domain-containing OB-fold protein n=1 Tax=Rhodococcus qingshengii TaxID=334542 RepID=UPI0035A7088C
MIQYAPAPVPTPDSIPFWESTREHAMKIQHCLECGKAVFYPRSQCPNCSSSRLEWRPVSGRATLASYVINRRPALGFGTASQIIALVNLAEGVRMMTNLVNVEADPSHLTLGMPLEVVYEERDDMVLPMFTPTREADE